MRLGRWTVLSLLVIGRRRRGGGSSERVLSHPRLLSGIPVADIVDDCGKSNGHKIELWFCICGPIVCKRGVLDLRQDLAGES